MHDVINESIKLNSQIKHTVEYQNYIDTKRALYDNMELCEKLKEFVRKNYELQNRTGVNCFDEVSNLVRDNDELLHNSLVSDYLRAERRICRLMQEVYNSISEGLEFDYLDGK